MTAINPRLLSSFAAPTGSISLHLECAGPHARGGDIDFDRCPCAFLSFHIELNQQ